MKPVQYCTGFIFCYCTLHRFHILLLHTAQVSYFDHIMRFYTFKGEETIFHVDKTTTLWIRQLLIVTVNFFQVLVEQLRKGNRISEDKIETLVENHVNSELPKYEQDDIETLKSTYEEWEKKRAELLEIQTKEYLIQQKEKKILSKFLELHQKEQLLTFFEKENELDIAVMKESKVRASTRKKAKTEGFVEAPGEREVKKMKKKK